MFAAQPPGQRANEAEPPDDAEEVVKLVVSEPLGTISECRPTNRKVSMRPLLLISTCRTCARRKSHQQQRGGGGVGVRSKWPRRTSET